MRNKALSIINLLGLTISMSLSLLIIIIVRGQFTYDNFHRDSDLIFRVNTLALRMDGGEEAYASVPLAVPTALVEEYDYVETLVRIDRQMNGDILYKNSKLPVLGVFVDQQFFEVFNFELESGNVHEVLTQPNTAVLTHAAALKLFGTDNALGEIINFGRFGEFKVTGVLKPFQGKSHFDEFEIYASFASVPLLEKEHSLEPTTLNWNNYYTGSAYIKLKKNVNPWQVEKALDNIYRKNYADIEYETRDRGYKFYLQNLDEITPGPLLSNSYGRGMPLLLIILLGALAGIVMIMACFNYTQLMIAKSLTRAKEVGVRKINGGNRVQIFVQFIGESVLLSLVSLVVAFFILQLLKYQFSQLYMTRDFAVGLSEGYAEWIYFFLFAVLTGVLAGLFPALYISSFNPLNVLRAQGNLKLSSRLTFRKVLLITQFAFSLIFVMSIIAIREQANYLVKADYGFSQEGLLNIRLHGVNRTQLMNKIAGLSGVVRVGSISHSLGTWEDGVSDWKIDIGDNAFTMRDFRVDENYLKNIDARFIAGKGFEQGSVRQVVLNALALKRFGFTGPHEAIGETIYYRDTTALTIAGIINDFHIRPLTAGMEPVAFIYDPERTYLVSVKYVGDPVSLIEQIQGIWKDLETRPLDYRFMTEEIDNAYQSAGLFDLLIIVGYCGLLTITLACLGVLGMAMSNSQAKRKEVAIRKITGASNFEIVHYLTKSFLIILVTATIIGLPLSYILIDQFLSMYAYKADLSIFSYLAGVGFLFISGLLIVSTQTVSVATGHLVDSLRRE